MTKLTIIYQHPDALKPRPNNTNALLNKIAEA